MPRSVPRMRLFNVVQFMKLGTLTMYVQFLCIYVNWWLAFLLIGCVVLVTIQGLVIEVGGAYDTSRTVFASTYIFFTWIVANSAAVAYLHVDEPRKYWIIGGIYVSAAFTMEAFRTHRHAIIDPSVPQYAISRKAIHIIHALFAHLYEVIAIAFVVAAGYSYSLMTTVPWGVPWALFIPPLGYTVYRIEQRNADNASLTYFTAMLICLLVAILIPADYSPAPVDVSCPINRNVGVCGGTHMGEQVDAFPGCCCLTGNFLFRPYNRCTRCQGNNFDGMDCCGNRVTPETERFLGGQHQCICGQTPDDASNKLVNGECQCNANHTCGTTCEIVSVSCNETQKRTPTECEKIEKVMPICLLTS